MECILCDRRLFCSSQSELVILISGSVSLLHLQVSDGRFKAVISTKETSELWLEFIPHRSHLSVSLDLGVNEGPQNVGCDRKVDEDELCLLMKAEQGEVVTQLHGLNGVFLLNYS